MAFSDPIVGTEVLIRNQIQSENFSVDPETGVTGWQIKRDGTATFNQLVIGGPNFIIDQNGDAVFHSITLTADATETPIFIHGEDIDPELYNRKAKGIIKIESLSATGVYDGTNDLLAGRFILPDYDANRYYKMGWHGRIDVVASQPTFIDFKFRYAWDTAPSSSSTILCEHQIGARTASATDSGLNLQFPFGFATAGGTDLHLAAFINASVAGLQLDTGSFPARMWVEDIGEFVTLDSWTGSGGGGSPPTQYTKTYSANGSASYQGDDDIRSGIGEVYQGQYSSTNGNQYGVILFPYSTIASDLTGATINKVEVYLNNNHWYYNSGGTAIIGYHNSATTPSSFTYPSSTDNITRSSFTYGQAKWVTVDNSIGTAFKNGTAKGILMGKGQTAGGTLSTDKLYYGYFAGNGQSGEPQLRITYTK